MQSSSVPISNNSYSSTSKPLPTEIVQAYGGWIQEHLNLGWDGYLVTFMFPNISGSNEVKIQQMHKEITRFYEKLATRAVRKPRSEKWAHLLPKGIFFPDVPGYGSSVYSIPEVSINDGIHFHGIMVATKEARLKEPLHLHLGRKRKLYVTGKIFRIDAEPITSRAAFVTDYGGKAIKRRRFSNDHVLLLPKTVAELPAKKCGQVEDQEAKAIKDIQSSMNVSEAVAQSIYHTRIHDKTQNGSEKRTCR
jgi:tRNA(Leu) C34 or U34 (ribose-2'-O)-methylase TrmL